MKRSTVYSGRRSCRRASDPGSITTPIAGTSKTPLPTIPETDETSPPLGTRPIPRRHARVVQDHLEMALCLCKFLPDENSESPFEERDPKDTLDLVTKLFNKLGQKLLGEPICDYIDCGTPNDNHPLWECRILDSGDKTVLFVGEAVNVRTGSLHSVANIVEKYWESLEALDKVADLAISPAVSSAIESAKDSETFPAIDSVIRSETDTATASTTAPATVQATASAPGSPVVSEQPLSATCQIGTPPSEPIIGPRTAHGVEAYRVKCSACERRRLFGAGPDDTSPEATPVDEWNREILGAGVVPLWSRG